MSLLEETEGDFLCASESTGPDGRRDWSGTDTSHGTVGTSRGVGWGSLSLPKERGLAHLDLVPAILILDAWLPEL